MIVTRTITFDSNAIRIPVSIKVILLRLGSPIAEKILSLNSPSQLNVPLTISFDLGNISYPVGELSTQQFYQTANGYESLSNYVFHSAIDYFTNYPAIVMFFNGYKIGLR
jgi:hypothetical protein